jgi:hypothetical protein
MRLVRGRLKQRYLLCSNETIAVKYPPQPVQNCSGYEPLNAESIEDSISPRRE